MLRFDIAEYYRGCRKCNRRAVNGLKCDPDALYIVDMQLIKVYGELGTNITTIYLLIDRTYSGLNGRYFEI
jgi:hypothetical protein